MRAPAFLASIIFAFVSSSALAKAPNPLERTDPVPDNQPIPALDFFRPPMFRSPELNPAGTHFVAIISYGTDRDDMMLYDLSTNQGEKLRAAKNHDIVDCTWLDDSHFIYHLTEEKHYALGMGAIDIARPHRATIIERFNVVVPIGIPRETPLQPLFWIKHSATDEGRDGGVVQIDSRQSFLDNNAADTDASFIARFPSPRGGEVVRYLSDKDGHLAFALTTENGANTLHRYVNDNWIKCSVDLTTVDVIGSGEKLNELFVVGPREGNKPRGLYRFDAASGQLGELVYQDEKYDLTGARLYRRRQDGKLLGVSYHQKMPKQVWFDPHHGEVQAAAEKALPGVAVRIVGSDREEKRFFLAAYSDVMPLRYFYFDAATQRVSEIVSTAPWISPRRMQPMMSMSFKTRDGIWLDGYLTLPAGASKQSPAPVVVLPHGGPWVREVWGWDSEAQFLASRGYAVFQPNYRGSPGYDCRYSPEDQWAFRKMHDDVTDGVKALLKTGLVDRDRMAIMGTSFGGYLALSGAVFEPDLYRCAVTVAGVFDWEMLMKSARDSEYLRGEYGTMRRYLGDPKKDAELYDSIAPLRHIDQVKIPVYVAHGSDDFVAPVEQSEHLVSELKKYHVPYEKMFESDETHGFHQLEHKVALYTAIEAFLAKNLRASKP